MSAKQSQSKNASTASAAESAHKTWREIFESIAIALALAFLFRTFIAEMFVIPTGSMAPTLCGRHKDVVCPKCGLEYQVGASEEARAASRGQSVGVSCSTCTNCGFTMNYGEEKSSGKSNPSYNGDRIIVGKYPYHLRKPKRWDVAVFLYPGSASMNYIKRVVGVPGETLRIWNGDIYVRPFVPEAREESPEPFRVARKPPEKILAMMQNVYDNDCQSQELRLAQFPSRWTPIVPDQNQPLSASGWTQSADGREFLFQPVEGNIVSGWLGYRHILPMWEDWNQLSVLGLAEEWKALKKPRLITDMVAYNSARIEPLDRIYRTGTSQENYFLTPKPDLDTYGLHWVGDLILECTVDVRTRPQGAKFHIGLVKAGKTYWCNFDLDTGEVELTIPGKPDEENHLPGVTVTGNSEEYVAKGAGAMNGVDVYRIRFANVDNQLHLWVNEKLVNFDVPTAYGGVDVSRPYEEDLLPVRIGCSQAEIKLSHLKLYRDIYYIAAESGQSPLTDFPHFPQIPFHGNEVTMSPSQHDELAFYTDPSRWEVFRQRRHRDYVLANGQYFMMGDNSAASSDCRIWDSENYVDGSLLVGEAYFVYWPHPLRGFIPNWKKFRMIH